MNLENLTNYYLYYAFVVNAFRVIVYYIMHSQVSLVKVTPEAWKNKAVQETMLAYTAMIRLFMTLRGVLCYWGTTLPESLQKRQLCSIMFFFDLFMLWQLFFGAQTKKDSIMKHQKDNFPPKLIQSSVVLFGAYYHYYWLM